MSDQNTDNTPEEEFDKDLGFVLPVAIRWMISIPAVFLILFILGVYAYLIFCSPKYIDPNNFGLPSTLIILIIILITINLPWDRMGFRIKKIGMIELENVVKTQARGNSTELADLQQQIDELKSKLTQEDRELSTDKNLDTLVTNFLGQYSQWAFSASRIRKWGCRQNGFEELKNYKNQEIRESLRRLLSKNIVVTRVSKIGSTIYKIK
jgi:predicted house-cleaning noncanonical NTP pyrophosphatase (MazG superfamily)